jgi:uncharacterized protein DUF4062
MGASPPVPAAPRIFLSSTHVDLADERVIVWQALRLRGMDVVRSEDFTPTGHEPSWEACERELLTCHGYLLLIGDEYGSRVPNSNLSFTHTEYERARKLELPVWVFMKDGAALASQKTPEHRDFIAAVNHARTHSADAEFRTPQELADAVERTFAAMEWPAPSKPAPSTRPRFGKHAAKQQEDMINARLKYAVGEVRQKVMERAAFTTVLVDTASIDRPKLRDDDPRRLLDSGRRARVDLTELGVAVRFLQEIWAIAGTEAARADRRIKDAADASSVIVCLVTGEGDYPAVRRFEPHVGHLGAFRPEHVPEAPIADPSYQNTYVDADLNDGRLTQDITDYVGSQLDDHLAREF